MQNNFAPESAVENVSVQTGRNLSLADVLLTVIKGWRSVRRSQ